MGAMAFPSNANARNLGDILKEYQNLMLQNAISCSRKIKGVKKIVGYRQFNLISWEDALKIASTYKSIEPFGKNDIGFVEELFASDPSIFGFFGERTLHNINMPIDQKKVSYIPNTGHYLFEQESLEKYNKIIHDVGPTLYLTSGIRNIPKQLDLLLGKIIQENGNLAMAYHSIAPIGFSYHHIGDFDVGKKGLAALNFSPRFAQTDEFRKLIDLSYVRIRYESRNAFGVRYEPWHIKVIENLALYS